MEVRDLRNVPIEELTPQEIAGRLALISDRMKEVSEEFSELQDMYSALVEETQRRVKRKAEEYDSITRSGDSSRS